MEWPQNITHGHQSWTLAIFRKNYHSDCLTWLERNGLDLPSADVTTFLNARSSITPDQRIFLYLRYMLHCAANVAFFLMNFKDVYYFGDLSTAHFDWILLKKNLKKTTHLSTIIYHLVDLWSWWQVIGEAFIVWETLSRTLFTFQSYLFTLYTATTLPLLIICLNI